MVPISQQGISATTHDKQLQRTSNMHWQTSEAIKGPKTKKADFAVGLFVNIELNII